MPKLLHVVAAKDKSITKVSEASYGVDAVNLNVEALTCGGACHLLAAVIYVIPYIPNTFTCMAAKHSSICQELAQLEQRPCWCASLCTGLSSAVRAFPDASNRLRAGGN